MNKGRILGVLTIVFIGNMGINALASELKVDNLNLSTKLGDEKKLNNIYEKNFNDIKVKYTLNKEDMKEEFKMDEEGVVSNFILKKKTEKKYEVAIAKTNGDYHFVGGANERDKTENIYNEALVTKDKSDLVTVINAKGKIIYAEESIGRVVKYVNGNIDNTLKYTADLYSDKDLQKKFTYINHGYIDDVPIIENNGKAVKVQVAGYTGWMENDIDSGTYNISIIPLNQVKNPSYYIVQNGELNHFISSDVMSDSNAGYTIPIGKAAKKLEENKKYYSSDGIDFYKNLKELILDLKENVDTRSVNRETKNYTYYLNLPFRSKTNYSSTEINKYLEKNTQETSKLRNSGDWFINAQNKYGVNALIMLGVSINESAWGMSSIAQSKNNIFGINAIDSNPGQAANDFKSIEACIEEFAKNYISKGYGDPEDWRHNGAILGNKASGANVKYASDPFWGEKASSYSFRLDKSMSFNNLESMRDYNFYKLGVPTKKNEILNSNGEVLYQIKNINDSKAGVIGVPIIINDDFSSLGWYKVYPDRTTPLIINGNSSEFLGEYDWDESFYMKSDDVKIINQGTLIDSGYEGLLYQVQGEGYGWQSWVKEGKLAGTVGKEKRLEGIKIKKQNIPKGIDVQYRVHVEGGVGFGSWVNESELAGTVGESKRLEAIQIRLIGENSYKYNIEYRVHGEDYGWQNWFKNGETAGTMGQGKRIEGIEIRLTDTNISPNQVRLEYQPHSEFYGWKEFVTEGKLAGTLGEAKRLEALKIRLVNKGESDISIRYRVHIEGSTAFGEWKNENEIAGSIGESLRMEAIQIELKGNDSEKYKLQYRVHGEDYGWQKWVDQGEIAGTMGKSKRIEGIEIRLIEK